jgi:hypothetical protein
MAFGVPHFRVNGIPLAVTAPNYEEPQEFWKPAAAHQSEGSQAIKDANQSCQSCGVGFVAGSRFCHACGINRNPGLASTTSGVFRRWFDFASLRDALGQSPASMVALVLGGACVIAAVVTGFLFAASTLLDWQAIQIWRIEWLLAAIAAFVAGILLKKK